MVLKTRYATENEPSAFAVAKSPMVTPMRSPPGLPRSFSAIAADESMPCTGTPRASSGSAMRPVPTPSSSARPSPASVTRKSTTGSTTSGANISAEDSSYLAATRSPQWSSASGMRRRVLRVGEPAQIARREGVASRAMRTARAHAGEAALPRGVPPLKSVPLTQVSAANSLGRPVRRPPRIPHRGRRSCAPCSSSPAPACRWRRPASCHRPSSRRSRSRRSPR